MPFARLVIGAALLAGLVSAAPSAGAPGSISADRARVQAFMAPSGNIRCRYFPSTSTVGCLTRNNGIETMLTLNGRPYAQEVSHAFPAGPVLAYGRSISFGGQFRCTSRTTGMFCKSLASSRCFLTWRTGQRFSCAGPVNTTTTTTTTTSERCDRQSYPNVCIPPYPPDLDCADVPYSDFTVRPPDPHGFDGDGDGYGCES